MRLRLGCLLVKVGLGRSLIVDLLLPRIEVLCHGRITRHVGMDRWVGTRWLARRGQVVASEVLLAIRLGQSLLEHAVVISHHS